MREGWCVDDYLILFDDQADSLQAAYGFVSALPGYRLLGLRSWDDFVVEDVRGARFTIPTVPLEAEYLAPFVLPDHPVLEPDEKRRGRIKWYLTPIIFGGDPKLGDNVQWVTLDDHTKLVARWNQKYREVRAQT